MIYPANFEFKTGFDKIRLQLKALCLSPLGEQRVDTMAFSTSFEWVLLQTERTAEMKEVCLNEENFPDNHFFDVTIVLQRLKVEGTFPDVEEVFNLRRSLDTIKALHSFFKEKGQEKYPKLWEMARSVILYPFVFERINVIITNQGKIKDNASPQLLEIRRDISAKESEVSKRMLRLMKMAQSEGWADDDASLSMREGRLVIPVNAAHKRRIKGFIHDESSTGKTAYVEPAEVVELNNDLKELEYAERREIVKILTAFANDIRPYLDELIEAYVFMGEVDFLRAKAKFAINVNGVKAPLNNHAVMEWFNAAHPLLFQHLRAEKKAIVPLDIKLNTQQRILVISGPNAGGKSVCLQTVGLLQYMLQCGLLIPLKETSETGIFNHIFIDIGDEQSIENDLSTYSSHLQNMKYFLRNSNDNTLFLIDEFGAGTEPMLGGAIAESILESLNKKLSFGVVTTHYTNLKHFAESATGIVNGAMLYDTHHLQPLFKLEIGEPGSSFAFEIARKIGLPEDILQSATQKVGEEHIDFDRHLKEIIRDKNYWKQRREQVKDSGKRLDGLVEKYQSELEEINRLRKDIISKAKAEAQEMLAKTNKQIENTIREIKEANAEKERTREIRKKLEIVKQEIAHTDQVVDERIARKIEQLKQREERKKQNNKPPNISNENQAQEPEDKHIIKKGDKVRIFGQDTIGEVLDVNDKSILVAFGQMTTTLHENRLEKISNNEFKKIQRNLPSQSRNVSSYSVSDKKMNFKSQLDVRGMRADEALQKVAEFIDDAIVVDVNEVRILHGKGNGILRMLIRDYLKTVDIIESAADEHIEFGGSGITVVRFE